MTGRVFGRLTVIKQVDDHITPSGVHQAQWLCKCSCKEHNEVVVLGYCLRRKNGTRSCGCLNKEASLLAHKKYNKVELNLEDEHGLYGIGYCSNTGNKFYFDMDDYDKIKDYTWYEDIDYHKYHRLKTTINNKTITMNIFLGYRSYDHEDRNPLNNRKYNLRKATQSENTINQSIQSNNTSGFIGVSYNKGTNKWMAYISIDKKMTVLGEFLNKQEAIITRLKAEQKYYREFAPQQHLFKEYGIIQEDSNDGTTD